MKSGLLNFFKKNPAILITVLSAYNYSCTYQYEIGFCTHFGIPNILIDITLINLLIFSSKTTVLLITLYLIINSYIIKTPRLIQGYRLRKDLLIVNTTIIILAYIGINLNLSSAYLLPFLSGCIITNLYVVIRFYYIKRKARINNVMFSNKYQTKSFNIKNFENGQHVDLYDVTDVISVFIFILFPIFCLQLGKHVASEQKEFPVITTVPNTALIKSYSDKIICKKFDPRTLKLNDSLLVIKLSDSHPLAFKVRPLNQ